MYSMYAYPYVYRCRFVFDGADPEPRVGGAARKESEKSPHCTSAAQRPAPPRGPQHPFRTRTLNSNAPNREAGKRVKRSRGACSYAAVRRVAQGP